MARHIISSDLRQNTQSKDNRKHGIVENGWQLRRAHLYSCKTSTQ